MPLNAIIIIIIIIIIMIEIIMLCILVSVWVTLSFTRDHDLMRNQKQWCPFFSKMEVSMWMKFSVLPQPVGLLKFMLYLFICFAQVTFMGENLPTLFSKMCV